MKQSEQKVENKEKEKSKVALIKEQLKNLIDNGIRMRYDLAYNYVDADQKKLIEKIGRYDFKSNYEIWYSEAYAVIKQLLPYRLEDFKSYYKAQKRKEVDFLTYCVHDAYIGLVTSRGGQEKCNPYAAVPKLQGQVKILESILHKYDSLLFDISHIVQYQLFDSELESARELNNKGFYRGAGAVAGVVLEKHLSKICGEHSLEINKKHPCINDYNELLKQNGIIEIKDWRFIQHLADIRNLCDHNKDREPKLEDISSLIEGTEKVIKTIF
jgi:hypothetical protein